MRFDLGRRATQLRPKQCANSSGEMHMPEIIALDQDGLPLSSGAKSCLGTGLSTLKREKGDQFADAYRAINPQMVVPTLVDDL